METATASLISTSEIVEATSVESQESSIPVLRLRLKKPKSERKVSWDQNTVDNEHMNKKKSKCCCIYKKPTVLGESSSEDDEECENCFGHPEKRRRNRKPDHDFDNASTSGEACSESTCPNVTTSSIAATVTEAKGPTTNASQSSHSPPPIPEPTSGGQ